MLLSGSLSILHCISLTRESLAGTMTDIQLNDRVNSVLSKTPYWCGRNLQVENHAGRVTLRGVVGTYYQKQMAQEVLRRVDGVSQIANELEVHWI